MDSHVAILMWAAPTPVFLPIGHAARSCAVWPRDSDPAACFVSRGGVETPPECSLGIRSARTRMRVRTSLLPRPLAALCAALRWVGGCLGV